MRWTRRCRVRMRSQGEEIRERSREARETSGVVAYGEVVWSWHPLLMSSRAEAHAAQPGYEMPCNPRGDGGKRNSSPGRSRISRKTIAWGMPDVSGASAVNTGVHTSLPQRTPGCGCIGHPAFPAPSSMRDDEIFRQSSGADCAARRRMCVSSFRGDAKHRTRNLEIPRCAIAHLRSGPSDHPGMTESDCEIGSRDQAIGLEIAPAGGLADAALGVEIIAQWLFVEARLRLAGFVRIRRPEP